MAALVFQGFSARGRGTPVASRRWRGRPTVHLTRRPTLSDYDRPPSIMSFQTLDSQVLAAVRTAAGTSLDALATRGPLLLVFLRHFGCPLCQEMVADVAERREAMTASGTTVVFVHMHPEPQAAAFFARFGVSNLQRVSDPGLYALSRLRHPARRAVELARSRHVAQLLPHHRPGPPSAGLRRRRRDPGLRRRAPGRRPRRARPGTGRDDGTRRLRRSPGVSGSAGSGRLIPARSHSLGAEGSM